MVVRRCWCGSDETVEFSADYVECSRCGTLVSIKGLSAERLKVRNDEQDFYGKNYWLDHQVKELGLPSIETRAKTELIERNLYWLKHALKYKLPPGRALEVGCSHGGFVALLDEVGFDAMGLELSPWVSDFASETFGISMLTGPIEDQNLTKENFDLMALMDVLEHLDDPVNTIGRCLRLLKPNGVLLVQTPMYMPGMSYQHMVREEHPFLDMLISDEHLYLFTMDSVRQLFTKLGADYVRFEKAIFSEYDMFFAASKKPIRRRSISAIEKVLEKSRGGRIVGALMTLVEQRKRIELKASQAEEDASARLAEIEKLGQKLIKVDAERNVKAGEVQSLYVELHQRKSQCAETIHQVEILAAKLATSEEDRQARLMQIKRLGKQLQEAEADRASRLKDVEQLSKQLQEAEADRASRLRAIEHLNEKLQEVDADRQARLDEIVRLGRQLAQSEKDRGDRLGEIERLQGRLQQIAAAHADSEARNVALNQLLTEMTADKHQQEVKIRQLENTLNVLDRHLIGIVNAFRELTDRWWYMALTRLPSMQNLMGKMNQATIEMGESAPSNSGTVIEESAQLSHIVVDLLPMLPGGANGGAKTMTMTLLNELVKSRTQTRFTFLINSSCKEELVDLGRAKNVKLMEMDLDRSFALRARMKLTRILKRLTGRLPWLDKGISFPDPLLRDLDADMLFCPFTAPYYFDHSVPVVSVIYDLQYSYYPEFFPPDEVAEREWVFRQAATKASHLICISDYVRSTVLEKTDLSPHNVTTVHIQMPNRLVTPSDESVRIVLDEKGLTSTLYVLYPANYWPHKNHRMLLVAFAMLLRRRPDLQFKLVFTGHEDGGCNKIKQVVSEMGLKDHITFAGFVADEEFGALLHGAVGVIFPSLYEGFGMPILEGLAAHKRIACSNVTSLPEVGGRAVSYFDPRKPEEIASALESLVEGGPLDQNNIDTADRQVEKFASPAKMASQYWNVFVNSLEERSYKDSLEGLFPDAWVGDKLVVTIGEAARDQRVQLTLHLPDWAPIDCIELYWRQPEVKKRIETRKINKGTIELVEIQMPSTGGYIEFQLRGYFVPAEHNLGDDARMLSVMLQDCIAQCNDEVRKIAGS